jgi:hypothetical protein
MTSYPLLETVAAQTTPVRTVCPDTLELYGYAKPVVDEAASLAALRVAYVKRSGNPLRGGALQAAREIVAEWADA